MTLHDYGIISEVLDHLLHLRKKREIAFGEQRLRSREFQPSQANDQRIALFIDFRFALRKLGPRRFETVVERLVTLEIRVFRLENPARALLFGQSRLLLGQLILLAGELIPLIRDLNLLVRHFALFAFHL
jgi:hypothetical protein